MPDKNHNRRLRDENLSQTSPHLKQTLFDCENNFGKYCYLPLDTAEIVDTKIVDWFFEHCKAITKLKPDLADTNHGYSLFNSINVCVNKKYNVVDPIWSDNQYPNFVNDFPHFYQQLMDSLPLAEIPRLAFWNSTRPIAGHRDNTVLFDMPNSFRVLIHDTNPRPTLWVQEDSDNGQGQRTYIESMSSTNSFVWNNLRVIHGSDYLPGHSKILLLINNFIPNYKKYIDMIERSVIKFADKTIISTNTINNFI